MPKPSSTPPVETAAIDILEQVIPEPFRDLVHVIASNLTALSLPDIVKVVFSDLEAAAQGELVGALQRRLNAQITRSAGNQMAHAVTKAIDGIIDDPTLNVPQDQKNQLGLALATQAAHQLAEAAADLLAYPPYQVAVAVAKQGHPGDVATAREARSEQYAKFNASLVNVGRLLAGDPPK